eukprot:31038-Prorocentrum_minimum.AAC.1
MHRHLGQVHERVELAAGAVEAEEVPHTCLVRTDVRQLGEVVLPEGTLLGVHQPVEGAVGEEGGQDGAGYDGRCAARAASRQAGRPGGVRTPAFRALGRKP